MGLGARLKAFVGVTDNDWFRFLRGRPELDEVNFWQPGGTRLFRTLSVGQPFLFKLHYPENFVAGGGFFAHASLLPAGLAWDAFGEKNGAESFSQMRERIEKYRRVPPQPHVDYTIGCIILQDPFFLSEEQWIPAPSDFDRNIVQGKSYDLRTGTGRELWEAVSARRLVDRPSRVGEVPGPMYGPLTTARPRLGQGAFRVMVTDTYERRCAVTNEKALPVLQAAHIRPVSEGGTHRLDNGLLLRSDVHTLFDMGYVTVTPEHRVRVSRRLRDEFHNGEHYYQFEGASLWVPRRAEERPAREFLEWHADTVYRG